MKKLLFVFAIALSSLTVKAIDSVNVKVSNMNLLTNNSAEKKFRMAVYKDYTSKGYTFTGLKTIKGLTYATFVKPCNTTK